MARSSRPLGRLVTAGAAPGWARVVVALAGAALLVAGAVAVFVTSNSAGAATLVAAGTRAPAKLVEGP
ncbi:hypothetical protein ATK36_3443 [Amycolatopsis sulphurea]|uniref:Uncharacterized protein n=1 Tax=Amycolatopsis sulphurea TaxID=76022 RepID=A0A2A9FB29_9PSEU|nr:hypothetical protein [Amycolatopsis sulphurea]PFG48358.1 hypothetical protein ATK36_3443 [Amycolatopsis sulphurea]